MKIKKSLETCFREHYVCINFVRVTLLLWGDAVKAQIEEKSLHYSTLPYNDKKNDAHLNPIDVWNSRKAHFKFLKHNK